MHLDSPTLFCGNRLLLLHQKSQMVHLCSKSLNFGKIPKGISDDLYFCTTKKHLKKTNKNPILVDSKLYFEASWISSDTSCLKTAISNKTLRTKHLKNQEDLNELLMREMRLGIEVHDRWTSDQIAEVTLVFLTPGSQMRRSV